MLCLLCIKVDDLDIYKFDLLRWNDGIASRTRWGQLCSHYFHLQLLKPGLAQSRYCAWVISSICKRAPLLYLNAVENLFIDWHLNWAGLTSLTWAFRRDWSDFVCHTTQVWLQCSSQQILVVYAGFIILLQKGRLTHEDSRYSGNKFSSMDLVEGKVEASDLFQPSLFTHIPVLETLFCPVAAFPPRCCTACQQNEGYLLWPLGPEGTLSLGSRTELSIQEQSTFQPRGPVIPRGSQLNEWSIRSLLKAS